MSESREREALRVLLDFVNIIDVHYPRDRFSTLTHARELLKQSGLITQRAARAAEDTTKATAR